MGSLKSIPCVIAEPYPELIFRRASYPRRLSFSFPTAQSSPYSLLVHSSSKPPSPSLSFPTTFLSSCHQIPNPASTCQSTVASQIRGLETYSHSPWHFVRHNIAYHDMSRTLVV